MLQEHFAGGKYVMFCVDGQFWHFDSRKWMPLSKPSLQNRILKTLEKISERRGQSTSGLIGQVAAVLCAKVAVSDDRLCFVTEPPNVINCANGELWIAADGTVELRPHTATSYLRHCLDIPYDADAKCPVYDAAVRQIFSKSPNVKGMVRHWHDLAGYFIAPHRKTPKIVVLRGPGSNAKTKLLETISRILGTDLVMYARIETLETNRFAIGSLLGKTLLVDDDVKAGTRLPDGELKKISEPKVLTGERKHGPTFNFTVRTVPVLICNNPPSIADLLRNAASSDGHAVRPHVQKGADPDLFPKDLGDRVAWGFKSGPAGSTQTCETQLALQRTSLRERGNQPVVGGRNPGSSLSLQTCASVDSTATCWMKDLYGAYAHGLREWASPRSNSSRLFVVILSSSATPSSTETKGTRSSV